jgi:hypothetical protein
MSERRGGLNFRRRLIEKWQQHHGGFYGHPHDEFIRGALQCDPASLERAAKFLGLDHAHPSHLFVLALVLAEELFGKRRRGRKPGNRAWDENRFLELGSLYQELKRDCPRTSDSELAETIAEDPAFKEYRNNPELIRQRLPQAKREWEKWADGYAEGWFTNREDDEDDDPASYADYDGL